METAPSRLTQLKPQPASRDPRGVEDHGRSSYGNGNACHVLMSITSLQDAVMLVPATDASLDHDPLLTSLDVGLAVGESVGVRPAEVVPDAVPPPRPKPARLRTHQMGSTVTLSKRMEMFPTEKSSGRPFLR